MDSFSKNVTAFDDTDGSLFEGNKLLQLEGSFDDIMSEHFGETSTKSTNESFNPGPPQLEDINSIYLAVSDDQASNLNTNTNTNQNDCYIPITSTNSNSHSVNKTDGHVNVIENISQRNSVTFNGGNCTYKGNLGDQEAFDAISNLNRVAMSPNGSPNVLVPLSMLKTLMKSYTTKSSQEVLILDQNTTYDESSQSQKIDLSNSQILQKPPSSSEPNMFASNFRIGECNYLRPEDHDCLIFARNTNSEGNKVDGNGESRSLNEGKVLPKNANKKIISRDKSCSRNKYKSKKHQLEEDNSSKHVQQDNTMPESCKVCGDIASVHIHYGGRSCQSCRAFFRRSVVKFSSYPGFRYSCKCVDKCFDKDQFSCDEYGRYGKNGCKYCRFMKCRESAGMVDEWVVSAYSLVEDITNNGEKKLIQDNIGEKRDLFENAENTSQDNAYDRSGTQPKRLKLCHTTLGNDENQKAYENENSTLISNEAYGVSCPSSDTKALCSDSGGDRGDVDMVENEEVYNLGQSSDNVTTKLSSLLQSFDNIQSLVSSLVQEQIQLKTRLDSLSEERKITF